MTLALQFCIVPARGLPGSPDRSASRNRVPANLNLFFSIPLTLLCAPRKLARLFSIHCALFRQNTRGVGMSVYQKSDRDCRSDQDRHPEGATRPNGPLPNPTTPNVPRMNTYAKSHFNPFAMNTYKNARLKVVQNEHLQKKGGGGGAAEQHPPPRARQVAR